MITIVFQSQIKPRYDDKSYRGFKSCGHVDHNKQMKTDSPEGSTNRCSYPEQQNNIDGMKELINLYRVSKASGCKAQRFINLLFVTIVSYYIA